MMQSHAAAWRSGQRFLAHFILGAVTLFWVLPIIWMILTALRDPSEPFYSGIIPSHFTLVNFAKVLSNAPAVGSFRNSLIVASSAAAMDLVIASLAAYGFSRFEFVGKKALQILLLVIRLFPGVLLAITLFQIAGVLHVYDSFIPLILANGLLNLPFAIWNLRTLVESLPVEIEEAAWIDGATRVEGMARVLFPLMAPGVAATAAFVFLLTWNEYLFAVSFIRSPEKQMITTTIAANIGQYNIDYTVLVATAMMASIPLLIIFLLIQRYIVSGLAVGAVKG
jgi:ABC-type glycerol-3-phosphate transport system permease component